VRLSPQYEVTHGYLGEACQMAGDRTAAREAYSHAFAINPQYEFAGMSLFDLALEDGDLAAAEATLRTLEAHSDSEFVLARVVQLAARHKATERAAQALERIATMKNRSPWPLDAAVEALLAAVQGVVARDVLNRVLENPAADPQVGRQWVRVERAVGMRGWEARLPELVAKNRPVGEQAVYAYLDALLQAGQAQELRTYIRRNERWLAQQDYTWGAAGYALANLRDYQATIRWMSDWQSRAGAEPWMLLNLVEALRALGRDAEAAAVSRAALASAREDGKEYHRLWLAADAVAAGDLAAARDALAGASLLGVAPSFGLLRVCVLGTLEIDAAPAEERPARFREVRRRIAEAWRQHPAVDHEPAHKRIWRAAARQIARRVASWPVRLWYAWVWFRSRLVVA
jgi:tetratricopeptide (TPR) repeat protein